VSKYYSKTVSTDIKLPSIPKAYSVANFATEQGWAKRLFVKINVKPYRVRVLKDPLQFLGAGALGRLSLRADESDYALETRTRPSDIESSEALPFEVAELSYSSKHLSLHAFQIFIGIVHSLTDVFVISSTVRLAQKGWSQRTPELSEVQWRYDNYAWLNLVNDPGLIWREPISRGEAVIKVYLESLIPKDESLTPAAGTAPNDPTS
jgi:hypothetical protein